MRAAAASDEPPPAAAAAHHCRCPRPRLLLGFEQPRPSRVAAVVAAAAVSVGAAMRWLTTHAAAVALARKATAAAAAPGARTTTTRCSGRTVAAAATLLGGLPSTARTRGRPGSADYADARSWPRPSQHRRRPRPRPRHHRRCCRSSSGRCKGPALPGSAAGFPASGPRPPSCHEPPSETRLVAGRSRRLGRRSQTSWTRGRRCHCCRCRRASAVRLPRIQAPQLSLLLHCCRWYCSVRRALPECSAGARRLRP